MSEQRQCEHVRPDGRRCRAQALPGQVLCYFHSPARAAERDAARRKGGQARSRKAAVLPPDAPDLPLRTVADVVALLAESINLVLKGVIDSRVGNCVGYLASVQLRALQDEELDVRVRRLEEALAHRRAS